MFKIPVESWLSSAEDHRIRTGRPFVTLSWAQSIDGSISKKRGSPLSLSGAESLRLTHHLRATHDAIAVGIGTVLSDNPQLTVRLVDGRNPQVVILDSHLAFPENARLLENPAPPWIAAVAPVNLHKEDDLRARGAQVLHLSPDTTGRVDLLTLLDKLAKSKVNSILVEGGARVITSFLQCQLADRVVITLAPVFVGGLKVVEELLTSMPKLKEFDSMRLGEDLILWGVPEW